MKLSLDDFSSMFGGPLDDKTTHELAQYDWQYEVVDHATSDRIILDLLKRIEHRQFSIVGENNERWQKGWGENLEEFRQTGDVKALDPKYLRPAKYLRLNQRFIEPHDPMFERNWYYIFRAWFARRFLSKFDAIYEFGCGSGYNVAWLAQEFPHKTIAGLDWAEASCDIVERLSRKFSNVIKGDGVFNFFEPRSMQFVPNSAVLTIGALEQTGDRWRPFLDFLRRAKPAACFHIEPIYEWYDPDNLNDYVLRKIHETRGFWRGYVDEIAPITRRHRTGLGSMLLEGYSQMQWAPAR